MPHHWKIAPLSDSAFRLHMTAMAWCSEFRTDGKIPKAIVSTLTRAPSGDALSVIVSELTKQAQSPDGKEHFPLWVDCGGFYEIHDYLEYNISSSEYAAKTEAAKAGGKAKAAKNLPGGRVMANQKPAECHAESLPSGKPNVCQKPAECSAKSLPDPDPDPEKEKEKKISSPKKISDPLRDQLTGLQPGQNPDVVQVHELWKSTFGKAGAQIGNPNGQLALLIRDSVRDYGLEDCLSVVKQAQFDGMVTGKEDERGKKHDDLFYILSQRTFDRLLVASKRHEKPAESEAIEKPPSPGQIKHRDGYWYYPLPKKVAE